MKIFELIIEILVTILFGGLGIYALYNSFRSYKNNRDFFSDLLPTDFGLFSIAAELILWISKKLASEKSLEIVYRILTFCFGLGLIAFTILYWMLIRGFLRT